MGLEAATYIPDLDTSNPLAGDRKNQGDDHLRLLKTVLKNNFPGADRPFRFDDYVVITVDTTLDETYDGKTVLVVTAGSTVEITLPTPTFDGWRCKIVKSASGDAFPVFVLPPSGTIQVSVGTVAKVRLGVMNEVSEFFWAGSFVRLSPAGAPRAGSVEIQMGAIPTGYLSFDGSSLLRADHPELFLVWGTTFGAADGTHFSIPNLIDRFPAFSATVGQVGGEASHTLTTAELPVHSHANSVGDTRTWGFDYTQRTLNADASIPNTTVSDVSAGPNTKGISNTGGTLSITNANAGSGNAHENRPPYFTVLPILRLC